MYLNFYFKLVLENLLDSTNVTVLADIPAPPRSSVEQNYACVDNKEHKLPLNKYKNQMSGTFCSTK